MLAAQTIAPLIMIGVAVGAPMLLLGYLPRSRVLDDVTTASTVLGAAAGGVAVALLVGAALVLMLRPAPTDVWVGSTPRS